MTSKDTGALGEAIFRPRRIALVGASADPQKVNARPQRYLRAAGFEGEILPVNPGRAEIDGLRCYPSVAAIEGRIDHAFLMVPAEMIEQAIDDCCARGVSVATLFTAGFAETGEQGRIRQDALVAKARSNGLRLIGPNCLGIIDLHNRLPLTTNAVIEEERLIPGPLSVISQSGSMLGCILSRAASRGLGFSRLVSVGNECDVGVGELARMMVEDSETRAILLFLETFRDPEALMAAARAASAAGKPIIAYKLGRSAVGRTLAAGHTGAMVGGDEVANAFFEAAGIMRVETLDGLIETATLVMGRKPPRGRRVTAITATGGGAAMVIDRLGLTNVEMVGPSPALAGALRAEGIHLNDSPLVDLPMGSDKGDRYPRILSGLLDSPDNDLVLAVLGSSVRFSNSQIISRILAVGPKEKPLAVFLAPEAPSALTLLQDHGVAGFRSPESCADAIRAYLNWRLPRTGTIDTAPVAAADRVLAGIDRRVLNEDMSYHLFAALGIAVSATRVAHHNRTVAAFDGPMAVKILSSDILHKTDLGLVRLNVAGQDALDDAVGGLFATAQAVAPDADVDGVLVQPMRRGLAEVIVGFRRDHEVGPVIVVGAGGVLAEIRKSISLRLAPVTLEQAREMVAELPELAALRGYRGLPRGDLEGLAHIVQRMSLLALVDGGRIAEAEINPLFVLPEGEGCVAVDGLVVRLPADDPAPGAAGELEVAAGDGGAFGNSLF